jgi:hypothetical protein
MFNLDIKNLEKDLEKLISKKNTFQLIETSYTARIKQQIGSKVITCMYSEKKEGVPPVVLKKYNNFILKYINKTRALAKKFQLEEVKTYNDVGWCACLSNLPKEINIYCIDIRSAYFFSAVNLGLFKKSFVETFNKQFYEEVNYEDLYKPARLVILGSLATKRRIRDYDKGICISDTGFEPYDKKARNVYVEVCRGVDNLMLELNKIPGTVGYYWDCVFATSEDAKKRVEDEIEKRGFDFKTEKRFSRIYYYPNGGGCIHSNIDKPNSEQKIYQFNYRKVLTKI